MNSKRVLVLFATLIISFILFQAGLKSLDHFEELRFNSKETELIYHGCIPFEVRSVSNAHSRFAVSFLPKCSWTQ